MPLHRLLATLLLAGALAIPAAAQERRVALIIGVDRYEQLPPLENAVNDARAVASRLSAMGFDVFPPLLNPTHRQLIDALDRFEHHLSGAEAGLVFYAGHAVEVNGTNWLLPIDAPSTGSERALRASAVSLTDILAGIVARARVAILFLDACRDNPLARDTTRGNGHLLGATRGLARIETPMRGNGAFVMFAAQPGGLALDRLSASDREPHGLFTRHLLRAFDQLPNLPLNAQMASVRDSVARAAQAVGRDQVPHIDDRMIGSGQFVLARSTMGRPEPSNETRDVAFWQRIENSQNVAEYEAYLTQFPQGRFAMMARDRIASLRAASTAKPGQSAEAALDQARVAHGRRDYAEATRILAPWVRAGDPDALYWNGIMLRGGQGRDADPAAAARLFQVAAGLGHADSMTTLASMYRRGEGVPRDTIQAIRWYREAARLDHINASYRLALIYEQGEGVPRDPVEAYMWLLVAGGRSPEPARMQSRLERSLAPEQQREAQIRLARWRTAQ